jgi:hypothetical protein
MGHPDYYITIACKKNPRTGLCNWWHSISKCPVLTAKEKLLVMEMLRRHNSLLWGDWQEQNAWMGYPDGWTCAMHDILGRGGYESILSMKHELPKVVQELRDAR